MEAVRKVLAITIGISVLVLIVFAANFVGQKIKEKYFVPKTIISQNLANVPAKDESLSLVDQDKVSTISAIPSTGPEDVGFLIMGLMFLGGLSSLAVAKRT